MALLVWDDVTWPAFVAGLESFRDHFPRAAHAPEPRPERAAEIVAVLNRWACRLSTERAPGALEVWLREHPLGEFAPLTIAEPGLPTGELGALHDDLIHHMQADGVRNMGPAAASKALYVLQPRLFVMWDKEISRSAPEGYGSYLLEMNKLAVRLSEEAPTDDIEAHLQELLGYETRKTLAKYLDEYNWFEAVGREQLTALARSKRKQDTRGS
ncbi:MAG TPA: hypothetical protein VJU01_05660 [Gaiellaceae bacterium]|nr:hypothetical protein [Gaiellaceae bacterium]